MTDNRILQSAWDVAFSLFEPIEQERKAAWDAAEAMPPSAEREDAFQRYYANLSAFWSARDQLIAVPAPSLKALIAKMETADSTSDEHFEACLRDVRRLAYQEGAG